MDLTIFDYEYNLYSFPENWLLFLHSLTLHRLMRGYRGYLLFFSPLLSKTHANQLCGQNQRKDYWTPGLNQSRLDGRPALCWFSQGNIPLAAPTTVAFIPICTLHKFILYADQLLHFLWTWRAWVSFLLLDGQTYTEHTEELTVTTSVLWVSFPLFPLAL